MQRKQMDGRYSDCDESRIRQFSDRSNERCVTNNKPYTRILLLRLFYFKINSKSHTEAQRYISNE